MTPAEKYGSEFLLNRIPTRSRDGTAIHVHEACVGIAPCGDEGATLAHAWRIVRELAQWLAETPGPQPDERFQVIVGWSKTVREYQGQIFKIWGSRERMLEIAAAGSPDALPRKADEGHLPQPGWQKDVFQKSVVSPPPAVAVARSRMDRLSVVLLGASLASYVAALALPAFYVAPATEHALRGLNCLIAGGFGVLAGYFCWLANPLLLAAWAAAGLRQGHVVLATSCAAAVLQLEFLRHREVWTDEGGGKAAITGLGPGYYLWCLAAVLMMVYAKRLIRLRPAPTREPGVEPEPPKLG